MEEEEEGKVMVHHPVCVSSSWTTPPIAGLVSISQCPASASVMLGEYQSQHLSISQSIEILFSHGRRKTYSISRDPLLPGPNEVDPQEAEEEPLKKKLTPRQWVTLATFIIINFGSAVCVSLQAPFYPAEAEKKGASPTEYGLVFGIFELTVFVVSPFYGRYITIIGPKFMLIAGIFLMSTCSILFGLIAESPDCFSFLSLSFAIRIVEAAGNAGYLTAGFSIIAKEFPNNVATAFGALETFFGLGIIAGPTIGGALYELGGYTLPFVSLGGFLLVSCFAAFLILPPQHDVKCEKCPSIIQAMKIPSVALATMSLFTSACSIGYLSATLEPHLRQFSLSPLHVGLLFIVSGAVYGVTTPLWGGLCDKMDIAKLLCSLGAFFGCLCFLFIGPAPFLPLETSLWLCIVALVFHGLCMGGEIVCGFIDALRESIKHGFPDNLATYGMASSLYTSWFALGAFVGPSIGGFLFDSVGFRAGSLLLLAMHATMMVILPWYYFLYNKTIPKKPTKSPMTAAIHQIHKISQQNNGPLGRLRGAEKVPLLLPQQDGSV